MSDHTAGLCIDQSFVDHVKCARAPLAQDGPPTRPQAVRPVTVRCSQRTKCGLQLVPLALLLLYDQYYKAWCHDDHGTSCRSCVASCTQPKAWSMSIWPIWPILRGHVRSWMFLVLATRKSFPKGCHLFGGDGRQAGTTATLAVWLLVRYNVPPTYVRNSSGRR